jgi:hypothetical protein
MRTPTQNFMLQCTEIPGYKAPFTAREVAPPPISMCEMGNLLEYPHLMKDPKYKDVWTKSFGTEIRILTKTTETIFFIRKEDIPSDRMGDETYARIVSVFRPAVTVVVVSATVIPADAVVMSIVVQPVPLLHLPRLKKN